MEDDPRQRFQDAKFIMLTSYKRDGTGVPTQMWCVYHEGRLYVRTDSTSYKVKRIANNSKVDVAPCDFRGGTKVEPFPAQAERQPKARRTGSRSCSRGNTRSATTGRSGS